MSRSAACADELPEPLARTTVGHMSARFHARRQRAARVIDRVADWSTTQSDLAASLVVGSYAYGRPRMGSDIDLVLLFQDPDARLADLGFLNALLPKGRLFRSEQWGPMHERRVRLPSGLQVEVGISSPQWAAVPVDPGTAKVLTDGCRVLFDPEGLVGAALRALDVPASAWRS